MNSKSTETHFEHGGLKYKKELTERVKLFREECTEAEKVLWDSVLRKKQFHNLKFTRQKPIAGFILDFIVLN